MLRNTAKATLRGRFFLVDIICLNRLEGQLVRQYNGKFEMFKVDFWWGYYGQ